MALEDVDGVDGRISEVPQSECGVSGRGDHQALGGVGTAVGQLLVMAFRQNTTMVMDVIECRIHTHFYQRIHDSEKCYEQSMNHM